MEHLHPSHAKRVRWWDVVLPQLVPAITTVIAVLAFWFGVVQYKEQQRQNRETAEREFMKPWLENQRDIYMRALESAATLANSDDPNKLKEAREEFWRLYQGKMIVVETKSVSGAMIKFGETVDGQHTFSRTDMNIRCRSLGSAMAASMAATAKMTFSEFKNNQFKYLSSDGDTPP